MPDPEDTPVPSASPVADGDRLRPEDLLAAIVESADDAILSKTLDGVVTSWNAAAERMYGYSAAEMIGTSVGRLVPPDRPDELPGILARLARGERLERFVTKRVTKDGRVLEVSLTVSPVHDALGTIVGASTIARDVTEGRRVEAEVRANESRFRGLLESNPNAVLMIDESSHVVYANEQAEALFGYGRDELSSLELEALVPARFRQIHRQHRAGYVANPSTRQMGLGRDLAGLRRDGTEFPVEIGLSSFESGGQRFVCAVVTDISARKQAEQDLRTTTERLRTIVASSPIATVLLDSDGSVRLWNPAAERLFGLPSGEVLGDQLPGVPESEWPQAHSIIASVAAGESIDGLELRRRHADGHELRVELSAAPWRDARGRVVGIVAQFADISIRRQLEEQLRQAQKMESIGRLAGGVAHDFNNVLTAITGFSQLLLLDLSPDDRRRDHVEAIRRAAAQASALTGQLLAFSRRQMLQPTVLDPNAVIESVEPMLRRLISERIELRVRLRPGIGNIRADQVQLEQVIVNLVVNARDAMPDGGALTIETDRTYFDEAYSSEHFEVSAGHYAMLAFSDTGTGMDQATREHIFEPFFTTKERGKGTGLGLATIYGVVRQSGGHIWLYSEPGEGTTFKVYFPLVPDALEESSVSIPEAPRGHETVLLVEDEDAVRELGIIVLERQGYRVLAAPDGAAALQVAAMTPGRIDLVITDVVMPELGGPELAERLRRLRPDVAVLFLSGYTEEVVARDGRLQAGQAFLAKPFTPDAFARKVREALAQGAARLGT